MKVKRMQFEVYIKEAAISEFELMAKEAASKGLETMALLVGKCFLWRGKKWTVVEEILTGGTDASAVSVSFSHHSFPELVKQYKEKSDKLIVGWIHSHPSYGCFLSHTDLKTQKGFFSQDFNVALVVDPTKSEEGKMLKRAFKLNNNGSYREASFAVIN